MNPSAMSAPAIDRSADPIRGRGGPHRSLTVAPVAKPSGRFGFPDGEDDISPFTVLAAPSGFLRNVAGIALTVALAAILVWQLGRSDPAAALEAIPSSPAFLAVFALSYLAVPFAEFVIYRRLWRLPGRGFVQLLRKRVANDLLVSYSGEVWFYLWARTHLRTVRAPFADVKDVSVLSAMAANLVTLSMALVAAPFAVGLVTGPYRWPVVGSLTVTALVTLVVGLNRRKLLSAPARVLAWITKVHVVRIVASTGLVALCWHLAMPHVEMAVWLGLAVLRMLVSRLPLLPAKEAVFAAVAGMIAGLDAEVTRLVAATAILTLLAHAITIAVAVMAGSSRSPR